MGDGHQIRAMSDPWLPWPRDFRPIGDWSSTITKVSDFILSDRTWNKVRLLEVFQPCDVEIILAIPLSSRSIPDKLIWHYDSKGRFTTKSAYHLARQLLYESVGPSSLGVSSDLWKRVWFSKVPGKVN